MRPCGRFLIIATAVFLAWSSGVAWCAEWDLPSGYPEGSLPVVGLRAFAADVAQQSGGRVTLSIQSAGSRVRAGDIWEAVRRGNVPVGDLLASTLHAVDPIFSLDSIPFLATDHAAGWRLYQAVRPNMQRVLASNGVELLYAVPWPPQGLFADRPIESAQALRGLTFRTYNAMTARLAELLEAEPRTVVGSELETALARRQIQAMVTSAAYGADLAAWQHFSHFYDLRAWLPLNLVIANCAALDALSAEERSALQAAAARAEVRGWQSSAAQYDGSLARLAAKGMTVQAPSPQLRDDLRILSGVLTTEWLNRAGQDGVAVINAYAR